MNNRVRLLLACLLAVTATAWGQNVGALRSATWELPQTDADRRVINGIFGGLNAVQVECPASLRESLAAERAYAACAEYQPGSLAEFDRGDAERGVIGLGDVWQSPWQENSEFGVVRTLALGGATYYVALDRPNALVFVIRFAE